MKKTVAILTMISALLFASFAEDFDDFDNIFDEEGDVSTPLVTSSPSSSKSNEKISFSGKLTSDLGYAYYYEAAETDENGNVSKEEISTSGIVFTLNNDFYINARPSDTISIKADLNASFSGKFALTLKELSFTYSPCPYFYMTAGKKAITWGYIKSITKIPGTKYEVSVLNEKTNKTEKKTVDPTFKTNLLSDAGNKLSIQFTCPWSTGSATFVGLYNYSASSETTFSFEDITAFSVENFSFAAAVEQTVLHTNINLFMRMFEGKDYANKTLAPTYLNPIVGLEVKGTVFGFDWYAQNLLRIVDFDTVEKTTDLEKEVFTVGFCKKFEFAPCILGFDAEYQYQYDFAESLNVHKSAFKFGVSDFGPNKGFKTGIEWNQDYSLEEGDAKFLFQVSKLIPYVTFKTGIKIEYDAVHVKTVSNGVTLSLSANY